MSAVGRLSPSRGRLLGPVTGARCVFPPKPRPPHLERGAGGGAWPRSRLVGPAGTAGLSGIAAAPRARVLVRGTGAARPVPGAPDTPARLSSSCCPQTPRGGGAAASRDGSALGCLPRTDVVSALHLPRPARLFSHVASDTDGPVTLALKHMPPSGFGRGRAWRGAGPPPVLCCSGSVHHWLPRQRGQKPWEPWRWGGRLSSLGL